jgi:signal transduction histidine kinase
MSRSWVWLQLVIGWLPIWALFMALLVTAHGDMTWHARFFVATRMVLAGAVLGPLVSRWVRRVPWPHPMRLSFVARHLTAAAGYGVLWLVVNSVVESLLRLQPIIVVGVGFGPFLILGVWLYVMQAGVIYASEAAGRASRLEAAAAQAQLATLRGQLHPHFLFNALHTIVQLAPVAPDRVARAAEDVAGLLRTSLEDGRDLVTLEEEWRLVSRYLDLERLRFGDRLQITTEFSPDASVCLVPSFALQTLVENAVRHGAAPRVEPTTIAIVAQRDGAALRVEVSDSGASVKPQTAAIADGGGLRRLRERMAVLYGSAATLEVRAEPRGVRAVLVLPAREG